jgi:uncharacterized membrane protein
MKAPISAAYRKFRTSRHFLAVLCTFIGVWVTLHFADGFDPDWGALNLVLSIEASIGMVFFMMVADKQDAFQRKQTEYMLHLLESQKEILRQHIEAADGDISNVDGERDKTVSPKPSSPRQKETGENHPAGP